MRKILDSIYAISGAFATLFLFFIFLIVIVQVGFNIIDKIFLIIYGIPVGLNVPSYADFSGYLLAATTSLGLAYTFKNGIHIRVSLLLTMVKPRTRRIYELVCTLLGSVLMVYVTFYMLGMVLESYKYGDISSGTVSVKMWIVQTPLFVGFLVLSISFIDAFIVLLIRKEPSYINNDSEFMGFD